MLYAGAAAVLAVSTATDGDVDKLAMVTDRIEHGVPRVRMSPCPPKIIGLDVTVSAPLAVLMLYTK